MQSSEVTEDIIEIDGGKVVPAQAAADQSTERLLPAGFEDLERFSGWILHTEAERNVKRLTADYDEIKVFYDSMLERQKDWLAHLDRFTVDSLPLPEGRLYAMALSLMEVAPAVEYFQSPDLKDAVPYERMAIHSPAFTARA